MTNRRSEELAKTLVPELVSRREGLGVPLKVETNGLVWMAVHGVLCLGLRHPYYDGPSRVIVVSFVEELGRRMVDAGVLTQDELDLVNRTEMENSPHRAG